MRLIVRGKSKSSTNGPRSLGGFILEYLCTRSLAYRLVARRSLSDVPGPAEQPYDLADWSIDDLGHVLMQTSCKGYYKTSHLEPLAPLLSVISPLRITSHIRPSAQKLFHIHVTSRRLTYAEKAKAQNASTPIALSRNKNMLRPVLELFLTFFE